MKSFIYFLLILSTSFCFSCGKKDCYDAQLYSESKDRPCTTDCPGVIGCDDNKYCNECEAARKGIRIK